MAVIFGAEPYFGDGPLPVEVENRKSRCTMSGLTRLRIRISENENSIAASRLDSRDLLFGNILHIIPWSNRRISRMTMSNPEAILERCSCLSILFFKDGKRLMLQDNITRNVSGIRNREL